MPENIDEPKSLHELVSKIPNDDKNRRVVGYSVGSYVGVLSALEKAKMLQNPKGDGENNVQSGSGVSFTSRSWTLLSNLGLSSTALVNEFYQSDLNQVRVVLRDYMPFVLDYTGNDGKILRTCVNRVDYASYPLLNQGMALSSTSNPKFPPGMWKSADIDRCKNGLADEGLGFVIGLGVAFNQVVINYFKHFYPQMPWEMEKLKKLAADGYLYGELMVPQTKVEVVKPTNTEENTNADIEDKMSGNAKVLHSKITVDISQSNTSAYNVFVPVPLMLIDDFKELGYVKVEHGNKTDQNKYVENVDGGKLKFPFSDKKFDHKKCQIEGFTPDAVKDYVPGSNQVDVEYKHTGLNDGKEVQGRMRFYFSPDAEGAISSMVGSIPQEYKEKLFRGVIAEDGYYKTETIMVTNQGLFQSGDIYWDPSYFTGTDITKEQYEKCVRITWDFEVDNPNGDWQRCKDVHDGQGLSYGPYQYTEKSGLLSKVVKQYLDNKAGNYNEHDQILEKSELGTGDYEKKTIYANDLSIINALKAVGDDQMMKNAQGQIFLETRAKVALNCMTETGMKSALGLQMWLYYINNGWNTGYKTSVHNATDEKTKCLALVNAHESRLRGLPKRTDKKTGEVYKPWERFGKGWSVFLNAHKRAINADNFNLDKPQIWRSNTV